MSLADELEAALCAPTWADSLAHVHAAIALRTERKEPADGLVEWLRARQDDTCDEAADALASRDVELAEAAETLRRNLSMVAGLRAEIAALKKVIREAVEVVRCHSDDRQGRDRPFDWHDGYQDGCRGAAEALRAFLSRNTVGG